MIGTNVKLRFTALLFLIFCLTIYLSAFSINVKISGININTGFGTVYADDDTDESPETAPESETDTGQDTETEDSDDLDGFEDFEDSGEDTDFSNTDVDLSQIEEVEESKYRIGGFIKEEAAFRLEEIDDDDPALSKLRTTVNLGLDAGLSEDWKFKGVINGFYDLAYAIEGRELFEEETLRFNESEFEVRDFYIDGYFTKNLKLKFGRQIMAWGESDFAQITDVANPRDSREIGIVDMEDARIPVFASNFAILFNKFELDLVAIHEVRPNKMSGNGSDFDRFKPIREMGITINEEETPGISAENTEFLARIFGSYNSGDYSIILADVYDDSAYLDLDTISYPAGRPDIRVTPKHKKMQLIGASGNMVSGPFVWKGEAAYTNDKAFTRDDLREELRRDPTGDTIETWTAKDTIQGMLGFDYTGISDLRLSLEVVSEHILDYQDNLMSKETSGMLFLLANYTTMNETLSYNFQCGYFTNNNGTIYKFSVDYDIIDAVTLSAGIIFYETENEEALLYPFRDEDRIFAGIKYSF